MYRASGASTGLLRAEAVTTLIELCETAATSATSGIRAGAVRGRLGSNELVAPRGPEVDPRGPGVARRCPRRSDEGTHPWLWRHPRVAGRPSPIFPPPPSSWPYYTNICS